MCVIIRKAESQRPGGSARGQLRITLHDKYSPINGTKDIQPRSGATRGYRVGERGRAGGVFRYGGVERSDRPD